MPSSTPEPLLSVCLITRNEERFLPGCLESVREVADEVVVVDSRSTDATVALAESFGCRVLPHDWDDDYSVARNRALAAARGQWVLCIDADERLVGSESLRSHLAAAPASVGAYLVERHDVVTSPDTGKTEVYPVGIVRLLRNHPAIRYVGRVHERPQDTVLSAGFDILTALHFKLTHLVNHLSPERLRQKQEKYLALLEGEVARAPLDFWAHYYRGKTLWYLGRVQDARDAFLRVAEHSACAKPLRASALNLLAALGREEGMPEPGLALIARSLELHPGQSFAHCVRGELLYELGRYAEAAESFARVRLSLEPRVEGGHAPGDLYMTLERRAYKVGCCSLALGELGEAARWFTEGLRHNADDAGCMFGMAHVLRARGDVPRALALLRLCLRKDPAWRLPRELLEQLDGSPGVKGEDASAAGEAGPPRRSASFLAGA